MQEKSSSQNVDELHQHHKFIADKGQEPLRVDKFIMNFVENATRNKVQKAAKNGNIFVNDIAVKPNHKVKPFDVVKVMLEHPPHENLLTPENIAIDVVYEDDELVIVNKPPGMVVHPGHGNYSGTLINALLHHFDNLADNDEHRPGLVHRIDKDTSGLLVIAKTDQAMAHLADQFKNKTSHREYQAIVWGNVEADKGVIEGKIGRDPKNRLRNKVFEGENADFGKPAKTYYEVVERLGYVTHIKCKLATGRTHQIRVHMKHIGHTLFNDERYGGEKILKGTHFTKYKQFVDNCFKILPRQALHAAELGFNHPSSGKYVEFKQELPDDMQTCINKWRHYAEYKL
ncbi:MAG: RluA family pseudouridine synthase [Psychroflexus sp.]|nr:RluA family pseudouridine synthase [Psychroflexus sp.]